MGSPLAGANRRVRLVSPLVVAALVTLTLVALTLVPSTATTTTAAAPVLVTVILAVSALTVNRLVVVSLLWLVVVVRTLLIHHRTRRVVLGVTRMSLLLLLLLVVVNNRWRPLMYNRRGGGGGRWLRQIYLKSLRQLFLLFVAVANVRRQITLRQIRPSAVRDPTDENSAAWTLFNALDGFVATGAGLIRLAGLTSADKAKHVLARNHTAVKHDRHLTFFALVINLRRISAANEIDLSVPVRNVDTLAHSVRQSKSDSKMG